VTVQCRRWIVAQEKYRDSTTHVTKRSTQTTIRIYGRLPMRQPNKPLDQLQNQTPSLRPHHVDPSASVHTLTLVLMDCRHQVLAHFYKLVVVTMTTIQKPEPYFGKQTNNNRFCYKQQRALKIQIQKKNWYNNDYY
jgi:hypothetical protein